MTQNVVAHLRYLRIAPRKTRFVADLIRGLSVPEAEAQLLFLPRRASQPLLKLLRSAIANARTNAKLDPDMLYVKEVRVDGGPKLKRFMPRSRGSAYRIEKKMSHVAIVLGLSPRGSASSRFVITRITRKDREKLKKQKTATAARFNKGKRRENLAVVTDDHKSQTTKEDKTMKSSEKSKMIQKWPGTFKKLFQRKAV